MLGRQFLSENHVVLDYSNGIATLFNNLISIKLLNKNRKQFLGKVFKTTFIPPYTEALIPIRCSHIFKNCDVLIEPAPLEQYRQVAIAGVVNHTNNCRTFCRVLNFQSIPVVLPKNKVIATVGHINFEKDCQPFQSTRNVTDFDKFTTNISSNEIAHSILDNFCQDYNFQINKELDLDDKYKLLKVLYHYKNTFARRISEIKGYKGYELDLELIPNSRPSFKRQYPLPHDDKVTVHEQLMDMKEHGFMKETNDAQWNTPLFLINRKGGGKKRLIADLRGLNSQIQNKMVQLGLLTKW